MRRVKILGTGLTGLVGSRIVEVLGKRFEFVNLSRSSGVDILDFKALKEAVSRHSEAKVVLHLAAFTDVNAAWEQRGDRKGECYQINVEGTKNVVAVCQEMGKYLIHFSTDFVFSGKKEGVYTEEDEPDPIEWYGYTKFLAEKIVKESGIKAAIVRIAFPFRARFLKKLDFVRKILVKLEQNSLYPLFVDQTITPTFIDDIAKGLEVLIKKQLQGVFHFVGSDHLSPYQAACLIAEEFGFPSGWIKKGSLEKYLQQIGRKGRPYQKNLALSNQKAEKLGVSFTPFKEALSLLRLQRGE